MITFEAKSTEINIEFAKNMLHKHGTYKLNTLTENKSLYDFCKYYLFRFIYCCTLDNAQTNYLRGP